jgi:phage gpG-like protein
MEGPAVKFELDSLSIDPNSLRRAMREQMPAVMEAYGERVGVIVKSQIQERFAQGGDSDIQWAPLWADNDAAVAKTLKSGAAGRRKRAEEIRDKADRSRVRVKKQFDSGAITRSQKNRRYRQAKIKKDRAIEAAGDGLPDRYRKGGKALRDNGILSGSFTSDVRADGPSVTVTVGSPLPHARYHNDGFSTSGPNYIPLTDAAKGGWNPNLIAGWDYIVLQGVTVPARPMMRLSNANIEEIKQTLAGA